MEKFMHICKGGAFTNSARLNLKSLVSDLSEVLYGFLLNIGLYAKNFSQNCFSLFMHPRSSCRDLEILYCL